LLTSFYGKDSQSGSASNPETPVDTDDDDIISKIKRRRFNAAQAAEERKQKEIMTRFK